MKKTIRKIYLCFIITILFTTGIALGNDTNLENKEYTEIYKQWLELSDEQKENVIEPSKYNFYSKDTKEEIQLANQKMNLKSLVKMAKSSTYATSPKFSLKTLIDNNLEIKDQKSTNFCWAFASISSLETNLALKNYNDNKDDKIYDYSERHMVYSMTQSFKDGQVNTNGWKQKAKDGGTTTMSMAYLTNGSGAINEEDMKFVDSQEEIDINDIKNKQVQTTVKDIRNFDSIYITKNDGAIDANKNKIKDSEIESLKEQIKEHISTSGSVKASIYMPNFDNNVHINLKSGAIYNLIDSYEDIKKEMTKKDGVYVNHAVSIIGWDDNYSKDNFSVSLEGNGAFICVNSWGDSFGDDGLFYVSYYDSNIGIHNVVYTRVEDNDNYDNIYQSDLCGWVGQLGYECDTAYFSNVYTAQSDEELKSVGFYATGKDTSYEIYYVDNFEGTESFCNKVYLQSGKFTNEGYYTVDLNKAVNMAEGKKYAIIVKITTPGAVHPIAIEYKAGRSTKNVVIDDGEGYISLIGKSWEHVEESKECNICLKMYTKNM